MLDKWDYSCNQNFSFKKSFASAKLWNKIKLHINLYIMGCPFSMYTESLSYSRAINICWMKNNPDGYRAFSSSLLHTIIARNHLPFFKIFSNLVHFLPKFSNIFHFFNIFCPFSGKLYASPYFLEYSLGNLLKVLVFLFLYLESNQVIILWKMSKKNK